MKDVFSLVKPACDSAGVLSDAASVGVIGGRMEAFNKHLTVSQPCTLPEFNVPYVDFDFALRKYDDPTLKVTEKSVMINGKTRIPRMPERKAQVRPDADMVEIGDRDDLLAVIDEVYPFTEGNPAHAWSEGARFDGTKVTATNSVMYIQAELASDVGLEGVTLSRTTLSYIRLRREALVRWGLCARGLLLEFDDGAWALAARMSMEMPDRAVGLISIINDWDNLHDVTSEQRDAFSVATTWADDKMAIHPDHIHAGRLSTEHSEPVETTLGDQVPAIFATGSLITVVSRADRIAFDRYPNPVPFVTKRGSRGLLAGRT